MTYSIGGIQSWGPLVHKQLRYDYANPPRHLRGSFSVVLSTLVLCLLLLANVSMPAYAATDTDTDTDTILESSDVLTISGVRGEASTTIPLPINAVPVLFAAVVTSTYTRPGQLIVTLGGRDLAPVDALTGGDVLALMSTEDLDDEGRLRVGLRVALGDNERCFDQTGVTAVLDDIKIAYEVPATTPRTVADFLTGAPRSVTVSIPPDASADVHEAAFNAVAVMAHTFAPTTTVSVVVDAPRPIDANLDRLVVIGEGPAAAVTVADGVLTVAGPEASLSTSVLALGDSSIAVVGAPSAGEPSSSVEEVIGSMSRTFNELGKGSPSLSGVGVVESVITTLQE